ncbi:hypothetical protein C0J52_07112 [Blattella germanica]|nr:hypothetical protein C0J52_07112 [Blattella germanica]
MVFKFCNAMSLLYREGLYIYRCITKNVEKNSKLSRLSCKQSTWTNLHRSSGCFYGHKSSSDRHFTIRECFNKIITNNTHILGCYKVPGVFPDGPIYFNETQYRYYNTLGLADVSTVSLTEIKRLLKSYGLQIDDGFACLTVSCPFCAKKNEQPSERVYINKITGFFMCPHCRRSGSWDVLVKRLADKKKNKQLTSKELQKEIAPYGEVDALWRQKKDSTVLVSSLKAEEISADVAASVISQSGLRVDNSRNALFIPLLNRAGHEVGFKILKLNEKEETIPAVGCDGVLSLRLAKNVKQDTAVVVSSVADAFALASCKLSQQIVCLPHGLLSLPQQVLPCLEQYNKLILWFGNVIGAWDAARNFAKKFDENRCYFVRPVEKQPSPHVALLEKQDLKSIVTAAQPIWHQAITTFSSIRQDVLSDLQNIDKVQGVKWKRFPALNRILKGHRRGEFTVLTGPTGSGKTTFMSEYSLDLAQQGVSTLWGSFEIRNARLARTMLQQMAGIPMDVHLDQFDIWADKFEHLPLYFMTFHGQQSIKVVMEAVEHATYVHDIAHVIIDNVQFMMGMSEEAKHIDRFWKQDAIIAGFRTFATRKNCHVTLVIHPRKERDVEDLTINSIFGGAKATQEADNILIIQDKRLTSVAKNRYSGDLGVMPLEFDKDSLSYGHKKKKDTNEGSSQA